MFGFVSKKTRWFSRDLSIVAQRRHVRRHAHHRLHALGVAQTICGSGMRGTTDLL